MEKVKRKLVAILAADAVGYSRHMGTDEEGTLRVLAAHRSVIDGIIDFHDGRVVSTAGDSVLAEFASPVDAVRCAVEIQDALRTRNDSLPEARRLQFRIGVNLGDVVIKGDDLLGDGVNVAARLEGIAEPGGICISSSVYDQISGKLNLGFVEIGQQKLKNIDRPIRVYRVAAGGQILPGSASSTTAARKHAAWLWVAAGGVAVIAAVGAGIAWQMRPSPPAQPATVSPPVAQADDARRAAEAKAQAELEAARQRAETQSKAEAEVAKARADAELAKARSEGETLRRQATEAVKLRAEAQAKAEMEVAKARAETELAKARADAEALRRQAASEAEALRKQTASEIDATRRKVAEDAARERQGGTAALPASRSGKEWTANRACDEFQGFRPLADAVPVDVSGDNFTLERGQPGNPGYLVLRGKRASDGMLALSGEFVGMGGRQGPASFEGRFDGGRYEAKGRMGPRPCTLTIIQRQP